MKKILKASLLIAIFIIVALIGNNEVHASNIVSYEDESGLLINELNMGDMTYDESYTKSFKITNKTSSEVTISNITIADPDRYNIVGTPATTIPANGEITIEVENVTGISASTTPITSNVRFTADNGVMNVEQIEFPITGIIVPKKITKPTVDGTYIFTPDVYGHGERQDFKFLNYDNSLMSMSGNTGGWNAGNYTTEISLADTINYAWDDGTTDTLQLAVTINKLQLPVGQTPVLPDNVRTGGIGRKLSTITLTLGWSWTNPDELIKAGENNYSITYTGGNYVGFENYVSTNKDSIKGLEIHIVHVPTDKNVWSSPSSDYERLNGESSNFSVYSEIGYYFTSITVNGVEQVITDVNEYHVKLTNITEDVYIETKTERMVASLIEPTSVPTYTIGSDQTLKYVFDYSMRFSLVNGSYINGKHFTYDETMDMFNFTIGNTFGVEIKNEYLKTLASGTYDFEIELATNYLVTASFVVEPIKEEPVITDTNNTDSSNPKTNDDIMIYVVTMIISLGLVIVIRKKKKLNTSL